MTMPSGYKLRPMQIGDQVDLAQVHLMGRTSYVDFVKRSDLIEISYDSYLYSRKKISENNKTMTLVATFKEQIIGFCDYGFLSEDNCKRALNIDALKVFKGELINIFLHPDHQGYGIGGHLFDESKQALKEMQLMPFMLWTLRENRIARSFYEKRGGMLLPNVEIPIQFGQNAYPQVAYRFD